MDQESPTRAADSRDPALLLQSRAGFDHRAAVLHGLLAAPLIVIILMVCKNVYIMAKRVTNSGSISSEYLQHVSQALLLLQR